MQYFVYGTVISFRYFYKYLVLNLLGESLRDVMRGVWIGYLVVISYQLRLLQHALKNISITINCSTSSCKYVYISTVNRKQYLSFKEWLINLLTRIEISTGRETHFPFTMYTEVLSGIWAPSNCTVADMKQPFPMTEFFTLHLIPRIHESPMVDYAHELVKKKSSLFYVNPW